MKKFWSLLLCLVLMGSAALAETTLNGGENRGISFDKADVNDPVDDLSPTTGRFLSELAEDVPDGFTGQAVTGRYMPILVQIDNADGGIGYEGSKATGNRAPWGVQYTDVIYETALYKAGNTRLSFLFSDIIPDEVGPCRSARLFHAWLREEWDCGFAFYGQQEYTATNVPAVFKETGADKKADGLLLFSGTVGTNHPWKQYYDTYSKKQLAKPHHVTANAAAMVSLIPYDFEPANHTWLFTTREPDGDDAETIYVNWAKGDLSVYNSILEWDEDDECYYRYMKDTSGKDHIYTSLKTKVDEPVEVTFNNIIVQFVEMEWARTDAPNPTVLGTGNADYFMGGKHIAGVWNRDSLAERTVFYDEEGEEIRLQPGRTLIIVMDYQYADEGRSVSYE
ncbi:MAG: DUF3048 C-terminal domain-containing protein [Clostridia bacterium]|nr:DUF3048 C-terminal domain-containing protein [Clostridia bacterium]